MVDGTAPGFTGKTVRGWFEEWQKSKPRTRLKQLPTEKDCEPIAAALNDVAPRKKINALTEGEIKTGKYQNYFDSIFDAVAKLRPAFKSLQNARKIWDDLEPPGDPKIELPNRMDSLLSDLEEFLNYVPFDDGTTASRHMDNMIFCNLVGKALANAGWTRISFTSDEGPVPFVVKRCLGGINPKRELKKQAG